MGFRFLYPLKDLASALVYLLRDEFTTADAAPLQDATADSGTVTTGTVNGGTYESTHADDGTNWEINEVVGTPGFLLTMDFSAPVAGQAATQLVISGNYDGNAGHTVDVDAYDWVADTYDTLGQLPDSAVEDVYTFTLESSHTDTDGTIRIRINHSSAGNVTHILYLDWVYVQDLVRLCEPGPGTLTVTDTGNRLSISGGNIVNSGGGSIADPLLAFPSVARAAGLSYFADVTDIDGGANTYAFRDDDDSYIFYPNAGQTIGNRDNGIIATHDGSRGKWAVIYRGSGDFIVVNGAGISSSQWKLLYVHYGQVGDPALTKYNSRGSDTVIHSLSVAQLPAPFDTDDGLATDIIASPSAGNTFTHEADCLIEFTVDTLPSSGDLNPYFRVQDSSNGWLLNIKPDGSFYLYEQVGGGYTMRGSIFTALSGGERILIICDDDDITVYYDNTQAFTYASATSGKTETDGKVDSLGTGGAISNLITWPRTLSGTAKTVLDKYTA